MECVTLWESCFLMERAVDLEWSCSPRSHGNPVDTFRIHLRCIWCCGSLSERASPITSVTVLTSWSPTSLTVPRQLCLRPASSANAHTRGGPGVHREPCFSPHTTRLWRSALHTCCLAPDARLPAWARRRDLLAFSRRMSCGCLKLNHRPQFLISVSKPHQPPLITHLTSHLSQNTVAAINFLSTWNNYSLSPINFKSKINLHSHFSPIPAMMTIAILL